MPCIGIKTDLIFLGKSLKQNDMERVMCQTCQGLGRTTYNTGWSKIFGGASNTCVPCNGSGYVYVTKKRKR